MFTWSPWSRAGAQRARPGDWWAVGILPLALIHLLLFLLLRSRPGAVGPVLWRWGPPLLIVAAAVLLTAALWSAVRGGLTFNPRRAAGLVGLALFVGTVSVYREYPSSHDDRPSVVEFHLPLDGAVTVAWGGPRLRENHHVSSPAERWGYDLLMTRDGSSHRGAGLALDDYYAYGAVVRAPAAGKVIEAHDGDPDAPPGDPDARRRGGNRIVLKVAPAEFLVLAHMKPGSIAVHEGELVRQGQLVGRVGNSGNSSEPHLHLHLQDGASADSGEAIPFLFADYIDGTGRAITRGMPSGGYWRQRYHGAVVTSAMR